MRIHINVSVLPLLCFLSVLALGRVIMSSDDIFIRKLLERSNFFRVVQSNRWQMCDFKTRMYGVCETFPSTSGGASDLEAKRSQLIKFDSKINY